MSNAGKKFIVILSIFIICNFTLINLSERTESESAPPISFGLNEIQYKVGDWFVYTKEVYENKTIDLCGNLSVENGGILIFNNVTLRMNVTANNQDYKIYVRTGGEFQVLANSTLTDSPIDNDTGSASDPDFRYKIFVNHGIFTIKDSLIEEVGPASLYYTFKVYGHQTRFLMENSTLRYSWDGLRIVSTNNATIKYSTFKNIYHLAVFWIYVNDSKMVYNDISTISKYGYHLNYGSNNYIIGCTIDSIGSYGIYWYRGVQNYIIQTNITNGNNHGIYQLWNLSRNDSKHIY
jgi:hypothetical protein